MTSKQSLKDFYRSPKLYVGLPSKGRFYTEEEVDWPDSGEIPIMAMTPKDEILSRNPDALLNGDAVIKLIESCCPNVKDAKKLLAPDMELLLVAIRAASSPEKILEVEGQCPECSTENKFEIDLGISIAEMEPIDELTEFPLSNGLQVGIKPANYMYTIQTTKAILEQANNINAIVNDENAEMTGEKRIQTIGNAFAQLAVYNYGAIIQSIDYITLPDGEKVIDRDDITEFVDNVDSKIGKEIDAVVNKVNNGGIQKEYDATCGNCEHEYKVPIDFDPVGFFLNS